MFNYKVEADKEIIRIMLSGFPVESIEHLVDVCIKQEGVYTALKLVNRMPENELIGKEMSHKEYAENITVKGYDFKNDWFIVDRDGSKDFHYKTVDGSRGRNVICPNDILADVLAGDNVMIDGVECVAISKDDYSYSSSSNFVLTTRIGLKETKKSEGIQYNSRDLEGFTIMGSYKAE